jgi:hypothetical protein
MPDLTRRQFLANAAVHAGTSGAGYVQGVLPLSAPLFWNVAIA